MSPLEDLKYELCKKCPNPTLGIISLFFGSIISNIKSATSHNHFLQFIVILNNMAIVLENFIQICRMAGTNFSEFLAIPKCN